MSGDRHAEHARIAPDRYGGPLARKPRVHRRRVLLLLGVVVVVGAIALTLVVLSLGG